jgi:murein DD-endopeptidase MepM/ murein hydrolase activator NlpD
VRLKDLQRRVEVFLKRAFVPREIFFRSEDRFHHIRISVRVQKAVAGCAVVAAGWMLYASGSFVVHNAILVSKDNEIEQQKLAYFDLLAEVSEYHDQFAKITTNLEENQEFLLSILEGEANQSGDMAAIQRRLKQSQTERARIVIARDGLRDKMQKFESDLRGIAERNIALQGEVEQMQALLKDSETERDQVSAARVQLVQKLAKSEGDLAELTDIKQQLETVVSDLRQELGETQEGRRVLSGANGEMSQRIADLEQQLGEGAAQRAALDDRIAELNTSLAQASDENAEIESKRAFLERRAGGLEQRLVDLRDAEQGVLERLSQQTRLSIEVIEKTVEMTGLSVNTLLAAMEDNRLGKGGPFVPSDDAAEFEPSVQLESSVSLLDTQLDRWEALQALLKILPLSAPLDQYRVASGYGPRKDPVNGRKASHRAVDFAAPMRSSVYATAPGKIIFAGWRGRYGRMIEIDHGNGIRTRYGHLRKILVKAGQTVKHREKIGLLGSSGRSTGPHVHYEVRFRGKAYNPSKFLKAGNHVFKS